MRLLEKSMELDGKNPGPSPLWRQAGAGRGHSLGGGFDGGSSAQHEAGMNARIIDYVQFRNERFAASHDGSAAKGDTFLGLIKAASAWLLREIMEGLVAYGETMYPTSIAHPVEASNRKMSAEAQNVMEQSANAQSGDAGSRSEAYVKAMLARSNEWSLPQAERRSR